MYNPNEGNPSVIKLKDSEVVFGHRTVQTSDVKWLCLEHIYQKLHRPNFYDIGGTYLRDVADYWFTLKSEQVGKIFLLHLFITNHGESSFRVAVSSGSKFRVNRKLNAVFLQQYLQEFQFNKLKEMSHTYLTTYSFSDLDVECLKDRKLYIATSFPFPESQEVSIKVIDNIKLNHDCGAILTDPLGSDFVIESADGVKFQLHKVILATHSEVFKAMLKEETAESQNSYVKLIDVNGEDLKHMLEFVYTGTVKDFENVNFATLLMLADRYNLKGLWDLSEYALSEQMAADNVFDILMVADVYDSDFLKFEALKFIKENQDVLNSSSFKEINNPDLLKQICTYLAT